MSLGLVSYDSSSEESDGEEPLENPVQSVSSKPNTTVTTKNYDDQKVTQRNLGAGKDSHQSKLFVPPPSSKSGSSVLQDEDGDYSNIKSKLGLPPPKRRGTAIRIPAPALPEPDSDDDEDEEPQPKKVKSGKKISSLFAMLPEPKHATLKQTNRLLIPHTLTKKKPEPSVVRRPPPSVLPKVSTTDLEEVEGGNFFSLDSSESLLPSSSDSPDSEGRQSSVHRSTPKNEPQRDTLYEQYRSTASDGDGRDQQLASSNSEKMKPRGSNYSKLIGNKSKLQGNTINQNQSKLSAKLVSAVGFQSETSREAEMVSKRNSNKLVAQVKPELNEEPLSFSNQKTPYGYQLLSSGGAAASSHHPAHDDEPSVQYGSTYSYDHQQDPYYDQQSAANSYSYPTSSDSDAASYHGNLQDSS